VDLPHKPIVRPSKTASKTIKAEHSFGKRSRNSCEQNAASSKRRSFYSSLSFERMIFCLRK
jgi:hypothetical protein